jgi:hypothetical protein
MSIQVCFLSEVAIERAAERLLRIFGRKQNQSRAPRSQLKRFLFCWDCHVTSTSSVTCSSCMTHSGLSGSRPRRCLSMKPLTRSQTPVWRVATAVARRPWSVAATAGVRTGTRVARGRWHP